MSDFKTKGNKLIKYEGCACEITYKGRKYTAGKYGGIYKK